MHLCSHSFNSETKGEPKFWYNSGLDELSSSPSVCLSLIVYTCVVHCVVCAFLAWTGKTDAKTKPFKKWQIGIKSFAFVSLGFRQINSFIPLELEATVCFFRTWSLEAGVTGFPLAQWIISAAYSDLCGWFLRWRATVVTHMEPPCSTEITTCAHHCITSCQL